MKATFNYEMAVYFSWLAGMGLVYLWKKFLPAQWPVFNKPVFQKPLREFIYALLVSLALVSLSTAREFLRSLLGAGGLSWTLRILIIYSPIFIYLAVTKQKLSTCFISLDKIQYKMIAGLFAALVSGYIFIIIIGNTDYPAFLRYTWNEANVGAQVLQTFLEGVAVGFLVYRLFALLNPHLASLIVAVIFMLGHIQSYTVELGHSGIEATILIIAHTGITYVILLFLNKTQDLISIFFLHWFINAASGFTSV
ncbi:MAG TPA: hypothetical protein VFN30_08265 [Chitinophagaceae bacterium]|nr:hypothetical protein [Chitinophagaceae bacterium]